MKQKKIVLVILCAFFIVIRMPSPCSGVERQRCVNSVRYHTLSQYINSSSQSYSEQFENELNDPLYENIALLKMGLKPGGIHKLITIKIKDKKIYFKRTLRSYFFKTKKMRSIVTALLEEEDVSPWFAISKLKCSPQEKTRLRNALWHAMYTLFFPKSILQDYIDDFDIFLQNELQKTGVQHISIETNPTLITMDDAVKGSQNMPVYGFEVRLMSGGEQIGGVTISDGMNLGEKSLAFSHLYVFDTSKEKVLLTSYDLERAKDTDYEDEETMYSYVREYDRALGELRSIVLEVLKEEEVESDIVFNFDTATRDLVDLILGLTREEVRQAVAQAAQGKDELNLKDLIKAFNTFPRSRYFVRKYPSIPRLSGMFHHIFLYMVNVMEDHNYNAIVTFIEMPSAYQNYKLYKRFGFELEFPTPIHAGGFRQLEREILAGNGDKLAQRVFETFQAFGGLKAYFKMAYKNKALQTSDHDKRFLEAA